MNGPGKGWLAIVAAVLLACSAGSWAQEGHAEAGHHQMLSDEHLERMENHMEQMLEHVQQMRATDDMEERRRMMEAFRQAMDDMEEGCPMCPMMEDESSMQHGEHGRQQHDPEA